MSQALSFDPQDLTPFGLPPDSDNAADSYVRFGLGPALHETFVTDFLTGSTEAEVRDHLRSIVLNPPQSTLARALQEEAELSLTYHESTPLTDLLRTNREGSFELGELTVPVVFTDVDAVASSVAQLPIIAALWNQREHPGVQRVLSFIQEVQRLLPPRSEGIDKAFQYIREHVDDPGLFIPHDAILRYYFLAYLPIDLRHAVQDTLLCNTLIDFLDKKQTPENKPFAEELQSYLKAYRLLSRYWEQLITEYPTAPETVDALAALREQRDTSFFNLQQHIENPNCSQVIDDSLQLVETMSRRLRPLDRDNRCRLLEQKDVGHCFNLYFEELSNLQAGDRIPQTKSGRTAVIYEDNESQRALWQRSIERHSPFTVHQNGGLTCLTARQVQALFPDPTVGLFLLDIQNGTDDRAGIKLAKQLLHALGKHPPQEKVEIIVWSNSFELVLQARKELESYLRRAHLRNRVSGLSKKDESHRIQLDIRLKSARPF